MQRYSFRGDQSEYGAFKEKLRYFEFLAAELLALVRDVGRVVGVWSIVDTSLSPELFAEMWIKRLREARLSISIAFSHASDHILSCYGMDGELQLARKFKTCMHTHHQCFSSST